MLKKLSLNNLLTVYNSSLKMILLNSLRWFVLFTGRSRSCRKKRPQGKERRTGTAGSGPALSRGACYSYFWDVYMCCVTDSYCWKSGEKTSWVILSGTTKCAHLGAQTYHRHITSFFPFSTFPRLSSVCFYRLMFCFSFTLIGLSSVCVCVVCF